MKILQKQSAQVTSKLDEYTKTYPDFEFERKKKKQKEKEKEKEKVEEGKKEEKKKKKNKNLDASPESIDKDDRSDRS